MARGSRLDEQHVPPPDRPELQQLDELRHDGLLQADTIAQAAERAGKEVASIEWVAARGYVPALQGPVVDFRSFFSRRGILLNYDIPGQPDRANAFGVDYFRVDARPGSGWTNVPTSYSPAKEERLTVTTTFAPSTRRGSTTSTSTTRRTTAP